MLLSSAELQQLERLTFASRAPASSPFPGLRRGWARGQGLELDDYREYEPTDDLRDVDWMGYARLGKLFVRLRRGDAESTVHFLLDTSASMRFGAADKLECARRLAAALGFVACRTDRVGFAPFADRIGSVLRPRRGRAQALRMFAEMARSRPGGRSDPDRALRQFANLVREPGVAVILSDFFAPGGWQEALRYLACTRLAIALVHVLADEEVVPAFEDGAVVDLEEAQLGSLAIDGSTVAAYRARIDEFTASLRRFCREHGFLYVGVRSSVEFPGLLAGCVRAGLLQALR